MFNSLYQVKARLMDGSEKEVQVFSESALDVFSVCDSDIEKAHEKARSLAIEKARVWLFNMAGEMDPEILSVIHLG